MHSSTLKVTKAEFLRRVIPKYKSSLVTIDTAVYSFYSIFVVK